MEFCEASLNFAKAFSLCMNDREKRHHSNSPCFHTTTKVFFSQCRKQIYCSWIGIWIEYCSITALTSCFDSRHLSLQEDQRLLYKILSSAQKFTNDFFSRVTEIKSSHFVYKKEKKLVECFSDQIIVVCIRLYMNCFSV